MRAGFCRAAALVSFVMTLKSKSVVVRRNDYNYQTGEPCRNSPGQPSWKEGSRGYCCLLAAFGDTVVLPTGVRYIA